MPFVRLRQIALNCADIDWAVNSFSSILDTTVAWRDPGILRIELYNALLYCGDCMLEIVSPTDRAYEKAALKGRGPTTQAKQLRKNGQDCGYMAIFQVEDLVSVGKRLGELGVREAGMYNSEVFDRPPGEGGAGKHIRYKAGDPVPLSDGSNATFVGMQWHPEDVGTLLETDQAEPNLPGAKGCWGPAGNGWQNGLERKSTVCEEYAGVTIAVPNPKEMAQKYATAFDKPLVRGGTAVQIDGSGKGGPPPLVKFISVEPGCRSGLVGVDLYAAAAGAGAGSRTRGKKAFETIELCGVRWTLVDRAAAKL